MCTAQDGGEPEYIEAYDKETVVETAIGPLTLPSPYAGESHRNESKIKGWSEGQKPKAPEGFRTERFADELEHPRWIYQAPNGDIFVAESNTKNSADRITLLRDTNGDGKADYRAVFKENLNRPFGMLIHDGYFYVANQDGISRFAYRDGAETLKGFGEKILPLPAGGYNHHWTRNIIAAPGGDKLYVTVGSASNVGEYGIEEEKRRACIIEINPDGTDERIFATGLRNPVGLAFHPESGALWTAVNERDKLGDELVPDYITSVKDGGFYGWPFSYFGQVQGPAVEQRSP